ncbi:uncharacterized protein MYCGRDRAFT_105739 [Zymoseptoria tritici IPO323]|uniref:Uncharacterized protein n=1 Tax=Zymoseptoria tritici (strain CBS 115943 / IPO323) TaxID=336722 RepID=F9XIX1_ZYMTI|nr:uncharacterized protein MYCGRDRAFT_105739 [Zymoseptoria tritici IPO323]EGP84405.1 hypothetical protein MYCGRDRAFT_105739 [Zymoseptoria tritici IPO323]
MEVRGLVVRVESRRKSAVALFELRDSCRNDGEYVPSTFMSKCELFSDGIRLAFPLCDTRSVQPCLDTATTSDTFRPVHFQSSSRARSDCPRYAMKSHQFVLMLTQ